MPAPVITPDGPLTKDGKSATNFTATNGVTTWSANGGTLSNQTSTGATWTAPNVSGTYTVTATNGSGADTVTITVLAVLPNHWEYRRPVDVKKKVLVFEPDAGQDQTRTLSAARHFWDLGADDSDESQGEEMQAFWDAHHPSKNFIFDDPIAGTRILYQTDSDFGFAYNDNIGRAWQFRIKEAYPYGTSA